MGNVGQKRPGGTGILTVKERHTRALEYLTWRALGLDVCAAAVIGVTLFVGSQHPVIYWPLRIACCALAAWSLGRTMAMMVAMPLWGFAVQAVLVVCSVPTLVSTVESAFPEPDTPGAIWAALLLLWMASTGSGLLVAALFIVANARPPRRVLYRVFRNATTIRLLLADGADARVARWLGNESPLFFAMDSGHDDIVAELVARGADVNARTWFDYTPLHFLRRAKVDSVRLLLDVGAEVNARDRNGHTPLHVAGGLGRRDIAELLLARGADVNAVDDDGETALDLASRRYHDEMVEFLLEYGGQEGNHLPHNGGEQSRAEFWKKAWRVVATLILIFWLGSVLLLTLALLCPPLFWGSDSYVCYLALGTVPGWCVMALYVLAGLVRRKLRRKRNAGSR